MGAPVEMLDEAKLREAVRFGHAFRISVKRFDVTRLKLSSEFPNHSLVTPIFKLRRSELGQGNPRIKLKSEKLEAGCRGEGTCTRDVSLRYQSSELEVRVERDLT